MNEPKYDAADLYYAIKNGDREECEQIFNSIITDRISDKIEERRQEISGSLFKDE